VRRRRCRTANVTWLASGDRLEARKDVRTAHPPRRQARRGTPPAGAAAPNMARILSRRSRSASASAAARRSLCCRSKSWQPASFAAVRQAAKPLTRTPSSAGLFLMRCARWRESGIADHRQLNPLQNHPPLPPGCRRRLARPDHPISGLSKRRFGFVGARTRTCVRRSIGRASVPEPTVFGSTRAWPTRYKTP
jgi:hypothetical protein